MTSETASIVRSPSRARALGLLLLGLLSSARQAWAEELEGQVVGVADGDTLTVLCAGRPVKVRLEAVDAPERDQPFGTQAKLFTSGLVFGKVVRVRVATTDKYGRTVGWVFVAGKSLNEALLRAGYSWHYTHYNKDPALAKLEAEARAARRGLWADADPTPPWTFRHAKRGSSRGPGKGARPGPGNVQGAPPEAASGPLHGNTRAKVFHRPGCKAYACKHCTASFPDEPAALAAGYRPCGQCSRTRRGAAPDPQTSCQVDGDCFLAPHDPCACPPCGVRYRWAVNRVARAAILARFARRGACRPLTCPRCMSQELGTRAVCEQGSCRAR